MKLVDIFNDKKRTASLLLSSVSSSWPPPNCATMSGLPTFPSSVTRSSCFPGQVTFSRSRDSASTVSSSPPAKMMASASLAAVRPRHTTSSDLRPTISSTLTLITHVPLSLFALRLATPARAMSGSRLRKHMHPIRSGSTALFTMFVPPHRPCLSARPRVRDRRRPSRTARLRSRLLRFSSRSRPPPPRRRSLRSTTTFIPDGNLQACSQTIQRRWTLASSGWGLTLTLCSDTS